MLSVNKNKFIVVLILALGVLFGLHILQGKEQGVSERKYTALVQDSIIFTETISSYKDSVYDYKNNIKENDIKIKDLLQEVSDKSIKSYSRTLSEDTGVTYWYVSYSTGSKGVIGYTTIKENKSFCDPYSLYMKIIKSSKDWKKGMFLQFLNITQISEAAHKNYQLNSE